MIAAINLTEEEVIERILHRVPYPDQISDIRVSSPGVVRFTWRGDHFRVSAANLLVEECDDIFLRSTNKATLLEALLCPKVVFG